MNTIHSAKNVKYNIWLYNIITIGIFSTLFFTSHVFFKTPFEGYASYVVIVILLPFFIIKYPFPLSVIKLLFPLIIFGIISVYLGDNTAQLFIKILINIFISAIFYYYVFHAYKFDIHKIVTYYMKGAYIVSLIGIIQLISYFIGFRYGYDYSWILNRWTSIQEGTLGIIRLNSLFPEPSTFGASIAPAFFISLYSLLYKKNLYINSFQNVIILVAHFLTFSTVAYIGILLSIFLLLINWGFIKYVVVILPILIFSYVFLYNNIPEFKERLDGLNDLYSGETTSIYEVHGSSYVWYNNYAVALENFKRNPLFGTGLGSHPIAFSKYTTVSVLILGMTRNDKDANSMALRLMSETGLYGLLFMLFFILKFFVLRTKNNDNELYWLVSNATLVIIFLQLLRQGNYTYAGFMFYIWLYYFNYLVYQQQIKEKINKEVFKNNVSS